VKHVSVYAFTIANRPGSIRPVQSHLHRVRSIGSVLAFLLVTGLGLACGGDRDLPAGVVEGAARSPESLARARRELARARSDLRDLERERRAPADEQILFGDLHVHTQYSIDAFLYALPIFGGSGSHPPADACDFARHCSALDFFSLNDHAEGLTPERWEKSLASLRECAERSSPGPSAARAAGPDLVPFAGWEWTQVGSTPADHFGHKNVIFPGLTPEELPTRPINALPPDVMKRARLLWLVSAAQSLGPLGLEPYADFLWWIERLAEIPVCPEGVDTRDLPADCRESAATPEILFEKLAQWGFETLVIPHGLAWGIHAPPGASLASQLRSDRVAPGVQRLLEVYSGHGNSESYRASLRYREDPDGAPVCPAPSADSLACCWRAGQLVRERCGDIPDDECEARVVEARRLALEAGSRPHWVLPDSQPEDWLDCDQCRDCFKPAMGLRPEMSAQFGLALSRTADDGSPLRFRYGLIGSSDDHKAQPGTGYKQIGRKRITDARGLRSERLDDWLSPFIDGSAPDSSRATPAPSSPPGFRNLMDVERSASFLYPGGLVAVHAAGRDRRAIWESLKARKVYGTSGPRILLWFELSNGRAPGAGEPAKTPVPGAVPMPMGSVSQQAWNPRFEVRAVGAFEQKPGCPEDVGLRPERIETLCGGECYHPSDTRHRIAAIEVVRIRPQRAPDEAVAPLIEDPWRRFECEPDPRGCIVRFEDPEYADGRRDTLYYVRALQEATPAINGANLRTRFDAFGNPTEVDPCFGGFRTPTNDDCLAPVQERAWSSPIFVDFVR